MRGRGVTSGPMTTRSMGTPGANLAGNETDDNHYGHDYGDDPKHLHPAGGPGCRSAAGLDGRVFFRVGVREQVSHLRVLLLEQLSSTFTNHYVYVKSDCLDSAVAYTMSVPKLWTETIETHRREVREAILDVTAALVGEHGLRSVTMSQIAEETGIGRATLYKYFPDVETILFAWHERQVTEHLEYLARVRDQAGGDAGNRLEAVLEAFALLSSKSRGHQDSALAALMHRDQRLLRAEHRLRDMIRDLLTEGRETGEFRDDIAPDELASYCLHALTASSSLPSKPALRRLVTVIMAGLRRLE